jgi:hypothetical protein
MCNGCDARDPAHINVSAPGKNRFGLLPAKIGRHLYLAKKSCLPDGADSSEMTSPHPKVAVRMPRRPARITQADVARAVRAARQAGADHVEVRPDGTILIKLSPDNLPHGPAALEPEREVGL